MKSNKQRRKELKANRQKNAAEAAKEKAAQELAAMKRDGRPVVYEKLAFHSFFEPEFVRRGFYLDKAFTCEDCGKEEIWTARQQKWWYEVAKGFPESTATRCRNCRRKERARKAEARRVHLEGLEKKQRKK